MAQHLFQYQQNGMGRRGGEPAADILTNHLRPEKVIIYTKDNRIDLIKD